LLPLLLIGLLLGACLLPANPAAEAAQYTAAELADKAVEFINEAYVSGERLDGYTAYVLTLAGEDPAGEGWRHDGQSLKGEIESLADLLGEDRSLISYLLANQNDDGGFGPYGNEYGTAPVLEALAVVIDHIPVNEEVYPQVQNSISDAVYFLKQSYLTNGYDATGWGFDHRCVAALAAAGEELDRDDWRLGDKTLHDSVVETAYAVAEEVYTVDDADYLAKHLNALYAVAAADPAVKTLAGRLLELQAEDPLEAGLFGTGGIYGEVFVLRVLGKTGYLSEIDQEGALEYINQFYYEHQGAFGPAGGGWGGFSQAPESDTTAQVLTALSYFDGSTVKDVYIDKGLAYLAAIQDVDTAAIPHQWDSVFATAETLLALKSLGKTWEDYGAAGGQWVKSSRTKTVAQCLLALGAWGDAARVERLAGILRDRQRTADPGKGSFEDSVYSDMWAFLALGEAGKSSVIDTAYALEYILGKQETTVGKTYGSWGETWGDTYYPDFLSTCQAIRALTYFDGDGEIDAAIDRGLDWLKEQGHDDGGYCHGWDDPVVDTAELIVTLYRLGEDPESPDWSKTSDGATVNAVTYLLNYAMNEDGSFGSCRNVFGATEALYALILIPEEESGEPGGPGGGGGDDGEASVGVAVVGRYNELLFRPQYLAVREEGEWGLTALGALDATGLSYTTSDEWPGFVTCIAGQCNEGMQGWMYKVNEEIPPVLASEKEVDDDDRVIWWYSKDWSSTGPTWQELVNRIRARGGDDDDTPPRVVSTDPADGATGVPVDKTVTVTFTENVRRAAKYDDISVEDAVGSPVAFTKSISGKVLTIDPTGDLDYATAYTVNIPAGAVEDTAGNDLAADCAFGFTTELLPAPRPPLTFTDMAGHWAEDCVAELVYRGILSGYPDGTFRPERPITRLEAACILVRVLGVAPGTGVDLQKFKDAGAIPAWAVADAAAAARGGLLTGYPHPDGSLTFEPAKLITRTEMAAIVARAMGLTAQAGEELPFTDGDQVSPWAQESVAAAAANGLISGHPDGSFRPAGAASRAECAAVIHRMVESF